MNEDAARLCGRDSSGTIEARIEPGDTVPYWSLYSVPAEVETGTVEVPGFGDVSETPVAWLMAAVVRSPARIPAADRGAAFGSVCAAGGSGG